jgi:cyclopropane fatty-acyl-phospholipid synthase-like methyltransferase
MDFIRRWKFHFWYYSRQPPPWDTGITPPEVYEFIANHPAGRALDLGCGTGTNVITLAQHGWQVTGVDYAWSAIRFARRKARQAGVAADLLVDSVTRLRGIDGLFDLILDIGCFHNLSPDVRPAYLKQVERLLSPAGTYLLYVHFKLEAADRGHGVVEADLERISERLRLVSRQDGSERGRRASAWLAFSPYTEKHNP